MKKIMIYAALLITLTGFLGCKKKAKPLEIGTWKTQQTIQPFVYARFLPDDRVCQVRPFTNPGDMKTALLAGSLDFCGTTLVHAIVSASRGEPVVLVASLCAKCSALVVGADSTIQTPADLKGKRIGYVPSTMHHILLLRVLHEAGLGESDVTLVRVDFFDMAQALSHGQIDAFLSGEPFPTLAVRSGAGRILSYPYFDDSIGSINAGMIVHRSLLEESPEQAAQLVQAHARATRYLQEHPEEWIQIAADFGNAPEVLQDAAKNIELTWDMDEVFISRIKRLGQEMLDRGMIEQLPDWDRLIETRFVDAIRKEAGK